MQNTQSIENKNINRKQALERWLLDVMGTLAPNRPYRIESLAGDASFRCYHRVYVSNLGDVNTDNSVQAATVYIIMDAPPEKESSDDFVSVAELMSTKVNVPDILAKDMAQGFLLLQDFGVTEFAHLLENAMNEKSSRQDVLEDNLEKALTGYYHHAIDELIALQTIDIKTAVNFGVPYYSSEKLATEMTLFSDWFMPYVTTDLDIKNNTAWQNLTTQLAKDIDKQSKVLVHRDYHSRNIMLDHANPKRLGIIDFQDAVIGSYTYDFVSLVRDAYVNWDEATLIESWHQYFWQALPATITQENSYADFYQDVVVMGVQRHLKVLGIFVRLSERDGKTRYLNDIPKVMNDLLYSLGWLANKGGGDMRTASSEFLEWLKVEVLPSYQQKFAIEK